MEFKHRRGNYLILFEKISEIPILIAGIIFGIFLAKKFDWQALLPIAFIVLSPVSRMISYFFTFYTLTEDHLIIESGIFTRKKTEIPFSTITTVDLSQNILFQFFKVYKIKVDNASQTNDIANQSNIILTLKMDEALLFKQVITGNKTEKVEEHKDEVIKAELQDLFKLGLLQSKIVYFFSILAVGGPLAGAVLPEFDNSIEHLLIGGLAILAIVLVYILSTAFSLVKCIITYYNFNVQADNDTLKIRYGLLNKKSFSLQKSKINGIILKQSLLMKLCRLYSAEVIVIGYGDTKEGETEQAIIFPIAPLEKIKRVVNTVLPEYSLDFSLSGSDGKAMRYFLMRPEMLAALVVFTVVLIVSVLVNNYIPAACGILILVLAIADALLKFRNAGISVGNDNVVLSAGGFSKQIAVVKTKSIESITSSGSIFKRERGYVSIKLGFIAPIRVSNITSLNLPACQFDRLKGVLKY